MAKTDFGKRLRQIRKERGVSQANLAKETGILQQSVSYYELGVNEPVLSSLIRLADYFDISLDELAGRQRK